MRAQHSGAPSANRYVSAELPDCKPICEKITFQSLARFVNRSANFIYNIDNFNWTRWLARPRVTLGENASRARTYSWFSEREENRTTVVK